LLGPLHSGFGFTECSVCRRPAMRELLGKPISRAQFVRGSLLSLAVIVGASFVPQLASASGISEWTSLGLEERFVYSLAQNDRILFAGTDNGVYKKDLSTENDWIFLGLTGEDISDIFINPVSPSIMYASVYIKDPAFPLPDEISMYKSIDNGDSWFSSDNGMHGRFIESVEGRPDNPSILFASSEAQVWRSEDAGVSWEFILGQPDSIGMGIHIITIDPSDPNTILVGGELPILAPILSKSVDGGETWTDMFSAPWGGDNAVYSIAIDEDNSDIIYAGMEGGIYKTTDGGETYQSFYIPSDIYVKSLIIDSTNANHVYAGGTTNSGEGGPIFREGEFRLFDSGDAGEGWTAIDGPVDAKGIFALIVDQMDPHVLYAGTARSGVLCLAGDSDGDGIPDNVE